MVGAGALIAAGSLVPPRKRLAGGWVYEGNPATPVRAIGADELAAAALAIRRGRLRRWSRRPTCRRSTWGPTRPTAKSASRRAPPVRVRPASGRLTSRRPRRSPATSASPTTPSVYFGCALIAGDGRIVVGPRTNVQDNSLLVTDASRGDS